MQLDELARVAAVDRWPGNAAIRRLGRRAAKVERAAKPRCRPTIAKAAARDRHGSVMIKHVATALDAAQRAQ